MYCDQAWWQKTGFAIMLSDTHSGMANIDANNSKLSLLWKLMTTDTFKEWLSVTIAYELKHKLFVILVPTTVYEYNLHLGTILYMEVSENTTSSCISSSMKAKAQVYQYHCDSSPVLKLPISLLYTTLIRILTT